jgi:HK97 family phage portal protein
MAWMDFVRRAFGGVQKSGETSGSANPEQWLVSLLGGGPTTSGIPVGPDRALSNPTVAACVLILSQDVAKLSKYLVLYEGSRRGATRKEITQHPAAQLLQGNITDWMTPHEYWRFHMMNYLLEGNHYDVLVRNGRGELTEIIPIPRGRVSIFQATDGELFYGVARGNTHEAAELQDFPIMIPSEYVMHDRGPTRDSIYGQSVIGWARDSIGLAIAGEDHASRTFSSGARPSGVLQHPKSLSDPARKRLKAEFDEYRGQAGALKTLLLEEGTEFKPVTMNNHDVQFIESRKFQVEEIARLFQVPRTKLGDVENSRSNNLEQIEQQYVTTTLVSHLDRIEWQLNLRLLSSIERPKMFFEFDMTALVRGDLKSRYEAYAVGRQWSWLSVNDIRNKENLNPIPDGDEYLQPVNMVPLGTPPGDHTNDSAPGNTAPGTQPPGAPPPKPPPGNPDPSGSGKRLNGDARVH